MNDDLKVDIDDIQKLDGKIYAMLSPKENELFNHFESRGRRYGISVKVLDGANSEELASAISRQQVHEIQQRFNGRVSVQVETK